MSEKKLALISDIVSTLETEGVVLTPNAVRARLKNAMLRLANESCQALGAEIDSEELDRIAGSRAFQEAIATLLQEDEAP